MTLSIKHLTLVIFCALTTTAALAQEVRFSVYQFNGSLDLSPGEAVIADADQATTATMEAASDDAASTETVAVVEEWDLVTAVLESAALRQALSAPLNNPEAWEQKKDSPVPAKDGAREGAIIAIDRQLQIKQLKPDLTDSLITAFSDMDVSVNKVRDARDEAEIAGPDETRAILLTLRLELNAPNPSPRAIAELLENLRMLQVDDEVLEGGEPIAEIVE